MAQCIVEDQVAAPDEMADHRDVGGVPRDERQRGLRLVDVGQRALELGVERPLARDDAARGDRGAVAVDRVLGGGADARIAVEAEIIVRDEIVVADARDVRARAGDAVMRAEERVADA